jgi:hypothetical protein
MQYIPFLRRLLRNSCHPSLRVALDQGRIQGHGNLKIEDTISSPLEFRLLRWLTFCVREVDVMKRLRDEGLDLIVARNDKAKCRKLAGSCD